MSKAPHIGRISLDLKFSYVVDLNNPEMVEYAKGLIYDDLIELFRRRLKSEIDPEIKTRSDRKLTEQDIPQFIREVFEDE